MSASHTFPGTSTTMPSSVGHSSWPTWLQSSRQAWMPQASLPYAKTGVTPPSRSVGRSPCGAAPCACWEGVPRVLSAFFQSCCFTKTCLHVPGFMRTAPCLTNQFSVHLQTYGDVCPALAVMLWPLPAGVALWSFIGFGWSDLSATA